MLEWTGVEVRRGETVNSPALFVRCCGKVVLTVVIPECLAPDELAELLRTYVTERADALLAALDGADAGGPPRVAAAPEAPPLRLIS